MKDRIKQLMESQHMTQQTFADFIGISSASLSSIFNGRTKPTLNTVEALRSKFSKISLDWLMYGVGPMFKDEQPDQSSQTSAEAPSQDEGFFDFASQTSSPLPATPSGQVDHVLSSTKKPATVASKIFDKQNRQITEIRIFYNDQTWESFVPKM